MKNYTIELDDLCSQELSENDEANLIFPESRAIERPLVDLLERCDQHEITAAKSELVTMARRRLDECFTAMLATPKLGNDQRVSFWLCNCEYTRRGIPPVFRNLPEINDDDPNQIADLFAVDLQWMAAHYPVPKNPKRGYGNIWKPDYFHRLSDKISLEYPRRDAYWFCNGFDMSDEQQRLMHVIKRNRFTRELHLLLYEMPDVRNTLAAHYYHIARDPRHTSDDPKATIERRTAIWFVGNLASWKPQATANLYTAYTGHEMTRQRAANTIIQIRRHIPNAIPKRPIVGDKYKKT